MANPPMLQQSNIDQSKRNFVTLGVAAAVGTLAFSAPACPSDATKEKALRVLGFAVNFGRDALPLLSLLGAPEIAQSVRDKVIPTLEKLKDLLDDVNIPEAKSTLETVRGALSAVANALLSLPESARRTTIIGIIASINVLLLTVEAFVGSEMSNVAGATLTTERRTSMTQSINNALEATIKP